MKPFLVDVPVRVNIWIRTECQLKQFEVLKKARPSTLFLVSDGGRNDEEWDAIKQNRELFDSQIDWECTVYKIYEEKNNGLYTMVRKATELIWSKVDRCIFLEDDVIPSVSYFSFCAELLEKYKDDTRVATICGMNHCEKCDNVTSDYFFSKVGSIWGTATWKRVFDLRSLEFEYAKDEYEFNLLKKACKKDKRFFDRVVGYPGNENFGGHRAGGEFFNLLNIYSHNMLYIVPKYNMICNIGATDNAAHASDYKILPHAVKKLFNMETYEYDLPLKHPKYMMPDEKYRKEACKILAYNQPFRVFCRRVESAFLRIRYKGLRNLLKRIRYTFSREKREKIEN